MTNYCLVLPYIEGGIEIGKKFAVDHCGHDNEHDEFYKIAGISRENVWIQRGPPGSGSPDLEIISIETNDPDAMFKQLATSNHPWAIRFREYAMKAYGLDFSGPLPPLNEHIINWEEE